MTDLPTLPISRTLRLIADKLSETHDQQSLLEAADMLERQSVELRKANGRLNLLEHERDELQADVGDDKDLPTAADVRGILRDTSVGK